MNWVDGSDAFYVVGSDAVGGMGAPELVPFAKWDDADAFAKKRGGAVKTLHEIAAEDVLAPVNLDRLTAQAQ